MEFLAQLVPAGSYTFADGFAKVRMNIFDELRKNPEAVINRLRHLGYADEAERIAEKILPTIGKK